jgi:glycine dehydrogenase subunit 1
MGKRGMREVAEQCIQKAAYAARKIRELSGFELPYSGPCFNEFVVRGPSDATKLLSRLGTEKKIEGGLALSQFFPERERDFLVCVTETNTREQIDQLVDGLAAVGS